MEDNIKILSEKIYNYVSTKNISTISDPDNVASKKEFINFINYACGKESINEKLLHHITRLSTKMIQNHSNIDWMNIKLDEYSTIVKSEEVDVNEFDYEEDDNNENNEPITELNLTNLMDKIIHLKSCTKDAHDSVSKEIEELFIQMEKISLLPDEKEILHAMKLEYNKTVDYHLYGQ